MLYCVKVKSKVDYVDYEAKYTIFNSEDFSINTYTHQEAVDLFIKNDKSIVGLKWDKYGFGKDINSMYSCGTKTFYMRYKKINNWAILVRNSGIIDIYYKSSASTSVKHLFLSHQDKSFKLGDCIYKPNTNELYLSEYSQDHNYQGIIHIIYDKKIDKIIFNRVEIDLKSTLSPARCYGDYYAPKFLEYRQMLELHKESYVKYYNQLTNSYILFNKNTMRAYDFNDKKEVYLTADKLLGKPIDIMRPTCINIIDVKNKLDSYIKKCTCMEDLGLKRDMAFGKYLYYKSICIILNYLLTTDTDINEKQRQLAIRLHSLGYKLYLDANSVMTDARIVLKDSIPSTHLNGQHVSWVDYKELCVIL